MLENNAAKRHFRAKKARLSIALIVLLSLFLIYAASSILTDTEPGVSFIMVPLIAGVLLFLCIVTVAVIFFFSSLNGPFKRLDMEMDNMKPDNNHSQINVRDNDNPDLKSFVSKINRALNESFNAPGSENELPQNVDIE